MESRDKNNGLEYLFEPIIKLVSSFSYLQKLLLAGALFAIPLFFIVSYGLLDHKRDLSKLNKLLNLTNLMVSHQKALVLASNLRNDIVLASLVQKQSNNETQIVLQELSAVLKQISSNNIIKNNYAHRFQLEQIKNDALLKARGSGSEGDNFLTIFHLHNKITVQLNQLLSSLVSSSGIYSEKDPLPVQLTILITNEFSIPYDNLGKLEAFGAFALNQGFIDSTNLLTITHLVELQENSYQYISAQLKNLLSSLESLDSRLELDIELLNAITQSNAIIEDTILFDDELVTSSSIYRTAIQVESQNLYRFRGQLIQILNEYYKKRIEQSKQQAIKQITFLLGMALLALYVFLGVFISVNRSLRELITFSEDIENGNLEGKLKVATKDEFKTLANVLEKMRLRLRVREHELISLTITDALTSLYNRKHFNDVISNMASTSIRSSTPLTLLLIDIDHFKKINDSYGHTVGDKCLIHVASIIKASLVRKTDYAFRYGGEEFAILLPHTDENGAIAFTEKLIGMIRSSPWKSKDKTVYITISVGISCCSEHLKKMDIESLINRADKALYDAKSSGRDQLKISEA